MELDISNIAAHYARMSDDELIRVATQDAHGLRPEVFEIIESEFKKRNLNTNILKGVAAQNREYTIEELERYAEKLRDLPCPACGQIGRKLNGTIAHTVMSFIIVTTSRKEPFIACPPCLDNKNNNAILTSALLGWWGIPWGLFKTPVYIYRNFMAKKHNKTDHANEIMLSYTYTHIGQIEAFGNDRNRMEQLIQPKSD